MTEQQMMLLAKTVTRLTRRVQWVRDAFDADDTNSLALLGITKALRTFDDKRGASLATWAFIKARSEVLTAAKQVWRTNGQAAKYTAGPVPRVPLSAERAAELRQALEAICPYAPELYLSDFSKGYLTDLHPHVNKSWAGRLVKQAWVRARAALGVT